MKINYSAPAELFMPKRKRGPRQPLGYRRFKTAAEAIRFAVEDIPVITALGAWIDVEDERFDSNNIREMYESRDYPLRRRMRKSS